MATALFHARSSVKKWGGEEKDYLAIHEWFDATKASMPDNRHRALRHHAEGIALMITIFGDRIVLANGKIVPTLWIGEQHVSEDLKTIPTAADWLRCMKMEPWMGRHAIPLENAFDGSVPTPPGRG